MDARDFNPSDYPRHSDSDHTADPDGRRWFHIMCHTYGTWLYGDDRGFRTRRHREHVDGDYKNPPPRGKYDDKRDRSRKLLKQPPVCFAPTWRPVFGAALRDKLQTLSAQVLCVSLDSCHAHVLVKMPPGPVPRRWVGRAKKHSNFIGKEYGWTGKVWAVRCGVIPIKDRQHQLNVYGYIKKHAREGAWVWTFLDGVIAGDVPVPARKIPEGPGTAVPGPSGVGSNPLGPSNGGC